MGEYVPDGFEPASRAEALMAEAAGVGGGWWEDAHEALAPPRSRREALMMEIAAGGGGADGVASRDVSAVAVVEELPEDPDASTLYVVVEGGE